MAESKSSPIESTVTDDRNARIGPERLDHAHTASAGPPHANFASRSPRSVSKMPSKLQERMDRLMADLAALDEDEPEVYTPAEGELTEIQPPEQPECHESTPPATPAASAPPAAPVPPAVPASSGEPLEARVVPEPTAHGPHEADPDENSSKYQNLKLVRDEEHEASDPPPHHEYLAPGIDGVTLTSISSSFSQQARQILEILRRRQEQLSYQKNELELREASLEKQMRQERLALVEKQRQLLSQVSTPHTDQMAVELDETAARRITPEWIAHHERGIPVQNPPVEAKAAEAEVEAVESVDPVSVAEMPCPDEAGASAPVLASPGSTVPYQAPYQAVIEEYVRRQAGSHTVSQQKNSEETPTLRQQADQLRQQHESAIHAMRQTRRQLELLKDIIVQQQEQWAERSNDLEQAKRLVSLDQREAAIRSLEERLQQAQVEILRDRVIIKQLERTARQSLSNADWNQRWQVISEETQSYLKKVNDEALTIHSETKRQMERLESRKTEMLLYRESLRSWIERQMKLISRRAAHVEEREQQLQERWEALQEGRQSLHEQQTALNQLIAAGLDTIDHRLDLIPAPSRQQEAA